MEMNNEINGVLKANRMKDINHEKLNEKIRERAAKYFSPQAISQASRNLGTLLSCYSYDHFIKKLADFKSQGSIFILSFSVTDLEISHTIKNGWENSVELKFGEVVAKDLDAEAKVHSEILQSNSSSTLSFSTRVAKSSKEALFQKELLYQITGRLGGLRFLLENTTFNRICKV